MEQRTLKNLDTKWDNPILENYFIAHEGAINSVSFNHAGKQLASGGSDGVFKIANLKTTTREYIFNDCAGAVQNVRFSPSGAVVASVAQSTVRIRTPQMRSTCLCFRPHTSSVHCVDFSQDGTSLVTCSSDKSVKLWDIGGGGARFIRTLGVHRNWVRWVNVSPDDTRVVSASDDGASKIWDQRSRTCVHTIPCYQLDPVFCAKFHSNGWYIVNCGKNRHVQVWDVRTQQLLVSFAEHTGPVRSIDIHPDGNILCSSSVDGTVKMYNLKLARITHTLHGHECPVHAVEFSKQEGNLASADKNGLIFLWRTNL